MEKKRKTDHGENKSSYLPQGGCSPGRPREVRGDSSTPSSSGESDLAGVNAKGLRECPLKKQKSKFNAYAERENQ